MRINPSVSPSNEIGIISDYDDTAVPSHDERFGDHFPGVGALYTELDLAHGGKIGDLHVVSARPDFLLKAPKKELPVEHFPPATIVGDGLWHFIKNFVFHGGLKGAIMKSKIKNIERLLTEHPNQKFVLFGDSYQYDPEVYAEIRRRHPTRIAAVVIHAVPGTDIGTARTQGMIVTDSALESARALAKEGLLDPAAVQRIANAR